MTRCIRAELAALFAAATVAALLALPDTPAAATFGGTNGVIAFMRDYVAYAINADGSGETRLSDASVQDPADGDNARLDSQVSYSADGTRIAFTRTVPYVVYYPDSNGVPQPVTSTWPQIFTADADGSNATQLTTGFDKNHSEPAFSPDGTQIAFIYGDALAVMNADGTGIRLLGPTAANHPSFSPDGSTILYEANTGNPDIFTIPAAGGSPSQLTSNSRTNVSPDFSPDGSAIVFISNRSCDPYCYDRVWLMNADGSNQRMLLHSTPGYDRDPQFSPDGKQILYGGYSPDGNRLFLTDLAGSAPTQLATGAGVGQSEYLGVNAWRPVPGDTTPPAAAITSPAEGAYLPYGSSAVLSYTCSDDILVTSCSASVTGGGSTVGVASGGSLDTTTPGAYTATVTAQDSSGNTGSATGTFTVLTAGAARAQVSGGETVSTGSVATPDIPVQTAVTVPAGVSGQLSVTAQPTTTATPSGFALFGQEVVLDGPVASAAAPYEVSFTVDSSALAGIAPADVQVFRNGVVLTGCTSPTAAEPDPCIASRGFAPGAGGDALVTVRTSHFSTWSLGRLSYSLIGPLAPLAAAPTINTAKAGASIPVKFRLGGDRGLDVLSSTSSSPLSSCTSSSANAASAQPASSAATSSLTYDATSTTYTYTWRTTTAMRGCRDLVLGFRDGSALRTLFRLR